MTELLDRSGLLSRSKRRYREITLPGGGAVRLQSLTGAEMRVFRQSLVDRGGDVIPERAARLQELLVVRTLVDAEGSRLFSDDDALNGVLDEIDGQALAACYQAARDHTGFAQDFDFEAIEAAVKNSANGQASATPA